MPLLPFTVGLSPTLHIRGIIADRDISKGSVIERCPVILVDKKQEEALKKTVMWKYYFEWNATHHAMVFGYGSLMNHSYDPNAVYLFDYPHLRLTFKAIRDIKKGEEIFINYNYDPDSKAPLDPLLMDSNQHLPVKKAY